MQEYFKKILLHLSPREEEKVKGVGIEEDTSRGIETADIIKRNPSARLRGLKNWREGRLETERNELMVQKGIKNKTERGDIRYWDKEIESEGVKKKLITSATKSKINARRESI